MVFGRNIQPNILNNEKEMYYAATGECLQNSGGGK